MTSTVPPERKDTTSSSSTETVGNSPPSPFDSKSPPERKDTASTSSTETIADSSPSSPVDDKSFAVQDQFKQLVNQSQGAKLPNSTYACAPSRTQRYKLNRLVKYAEPARLIQASSISFPDEKPLPLGWEQHIHPEGLPYFVRLLPDNSRMRRVVTEEWMYNSETSTLIQGFIDGIQNAISGPGVTIWPESDLFLELLRDQGEIVVGGDDVQAHCGYYFVHGPSRCIYWPENVTLKPFTSKILTSMWGDLSGYQTQLCLEAEYWTHWNHFPSLHIATPDISDHVVDTIVGMLTDVISAPHNSSTIFSYEELQKMLKLVKMTRDCSTSSWHIGRFMMLLTQDRLRNYHGVWGTRLNRSQSVVKVEHESHSIIVDIVSPFLFFIPHAQLERAEAIAVDRYIMSHQWESFLVEIQEEWNQTSVLATITLAANCAFLAIPIFQDPTLIAHSSPDQIASYLSVTTSLFGLILALIFYRHHKTRKTHLPCELFEYIHGENEEDVDYKRFERLLLVWSLPHGLVMWSAITFALAFLFMCLLGTHTKTKIAIGLSSSLLGSFTFYCIVKFGSGRRLFRIWLGRIGRSMKRLFRRPT